DCFPAGGNASHDEFPICSRNRGHVGKGASNWTCRRSDTLDPARSAAVRPTKYTSPKPSLHYKHWRSNAAVGAGYLTESHTSDQDLLDVRPDRGVSLNVSSA